MKTTMTQVGFLCLAAGMALYGCQKKSEPGTDVQTMEQDQRVAEQPGMEEKERGEAGDAKSMELKEEMRALENDLEQLGNRMDKVIQGMEEESAQTYEESVEKVKNIQKRAKQQVEQTAKNMENQSAEVRGSMKKATQNTLNELKEAIDDLQKSLENENQPKNE